MTLGVGTLGSVAPVGSAVGAGIGGTLGDGVVVGEVFWKPGGTDGLWSVGTWLEEGSTTLEKILDRRRRVACWLSLIGESGEAGEGLRRAVTRSLAAAMARLVEDDSGMAIFVGNHARVSAIRSARVSQIQTR